ncbi:MAG: arginine deiminase-related protein [Acidobacteriaceae bacterium]
MTPQSTIISHVGQIPSRNFLDDLPRMPHPNSVLMCSPEYFDVIDVKNPFMENQSGKIDRAHAQKQWDALRRSLAEIGLNVELIPPVSGCEDMVFTANQTFVGLDDNQHKICVLGRMKFASRQREVPHFAAWFKRQGYEIHALNGGYLFEGGGDALWHPGRRLIWGGYGQRTAPEVYSEISGLFAAPVVLLPLQTERFYHLDTCFCPVDETTALVHFPALAESGQELIRRVFTNLIEVDEHEATDLFACNAAAFHGRNVVLQRGSSKTTQRLSELGFQVRQVETGEFMKSGGSVFCMTTAFV